MQHHQTLAAGKESKAAAHPSIATPLSTASLPFIDNYTAGFLQRKPQGWISPKDHWPMAPACPPIHLDRQSAETIIERTPPLQ